MKRGETHSAETRAKIASTMRGLSAQISESTKARMADPAVRQRIRDGMSAAKSASRSLTLLQVAWQASPPAARKLFLEDIFSSVCSASAPRDAAAEK